MRRRSAIKQIMIIAGGLALMPSCMRDKGKASIVLSKLDISADEEDLLAEVGETIIPESETPGAKSLNLHLFVLKMVDACHNKQDQEFFIKGLHELDHLAERTHNNIFLNCSTEQRLSLLEDVEAHFEKNEDVHQFYGIMKRRTIQGYLNSKYVMTNLQKYELVPGRYNGYFPVEKA